MLVPTSGSVATTTGMSFVSPRPFTPETNPFVVARILAPGQVPRSLEFALPASVKALTPIGVLVPEETLLTDANWPISLIVIRHHHFGTSPERGRVMDCPPSSCNPVYERLDQSSVSFTHLESPFVFLICFCFPFAFYCWRLLISKHHANTEFSRRNMDSEHIAKTFWSYMPVANTVYILNLIIIYDLQ